MAGWKWSSLFFPLSFGVFPVPCCSFPFSSIPTSYTSYTSYTSSIWSWMSFMCNNHWLWLPCCLRCCAAWLRCRCDRCDRCRDKIVPILKFNPFKWAANRSRSCLERKTYSEPVLPAPLEYHRSFRRSWGSRSITNPSSATRTTLWMGQSLVTMSAPFRKWAWKSVKSKKKSVSIDHTRRCIQT